MSPIENLLELYAKIIGYHNLSTL